MCRAELINKIICLGDKITKLYTLWAALSDETAAARRNRIILQINKKRRLRGLYNYLLNKL